MDKRTTNQEDILDSENVVIYKNDNFKKKTLAFIVIILLALNGFISLVSGIYLTNLNAYDKGKQEYLKESMKIIAYEPMSEIENILYTYDGKTQKYFKNADTILNKELIPAIKKVTEENLSNDFKFTITNKYEDVVFDNFKNSFETDYIYTMYFRYNPISLRCINNGISTTPQVDDFSKYPDDVVFCINMYMDVDSNLGIINNIGLPFFIFNLMYDLKYVVWINFALSIILAFLLYVFLLRSAGRINGRNGVHISSLAKIPLELYILGLFMISVIPVALYYEFFEDFILHNHNLGEFSQIFTFLSLMAINICIIYIPLFIEFSMNIAVRIKSETFFKNTILVTLCKLPSAILRKISEILIDVNISIKATILFSIFIVGEIFIILISEPYKLEFFILTWLIRTAVLVLFLVIMLKNLQILNKGIKDIANGDFDKKIDTSKMFGEMKKHGQYMNHINVGMEEAVNKKLKSERMKTELLTNVSHDIKTPLTSIINYTDLLQKEELHNEKAKEYIDVLSRQSNRLKIFIDDLVEASKAATGNLEVHLMPCNLNVLIEQSKGEYEEKMKEQNLEMVAQIQDEDLSIMADPRLLQRIFDNLLNNICKYSQENTRVYINTDSDEKNATITLKNTSKFPLNISPEELMERFVRGDKSRHTEGSGLGLSITKNLTELQKGKFDISIDGDLFKVILTFPKNTDTNEENDLNDNDDSNATSENSDTEISSISEN